MHDAGMTEHVLREVGELPRLQSIRSLSGATEDGDRTPSVELQQQYSGNSVTEAVAKFTVLQIIGWQRFLLKSLSAYTGVKTRSRSHYSVST